MKYIKRITTTNYPDYGKCIISLSLIPETSLNAYKEGKINSYQLDKTSRIIVSMDFGIYKEASKKAEEEIKKELEELYKKAEEIYADCDHKVRLTYIRKRKYE